MSKTTRQTIERGVYDYKVEKVLEQIASLNEKLENELPYINHGGCGLFTKLLYEKLVADHPTIKIIWFDSYLSAEERNDLITYTTNNGYGDGRGNSLSCSHIMIELYGFHIDGHTIYKQFDHQWANRTYQGYFTIDELNLAIKYGYWNSMYDKSKTPVVEKLIDKILQ